MSGWSRLGIASVVVTVMAGLTVAPCRAADAQVLAPTRGQVGWLDLSAPRPRPITALKLPDYPADVTAVAGSSLAVASVVSRFNGTGPLGTDLVTIDLLTGAMQPLLSRQSGDELLDLPMFMPHARSVLYQHTLHGATSSTRVEEIGLDGVPTGFVIEDARQPAPSPDGSDVVFVRYVDQHAELVVHTLQDGSERPAVADVRMIAMAYPRYSPDGRTIAFVAITTVGAGTDLHIANAHGIPWEVWLVHSDGSDLHQIPDAINDDPSVAWSPDGSQLLVYGGWGSYLIEPASGNFDMLSYLPGYGALAWLAD